MLTLWPSRSQLPAPPLCRRTSKQQIMPALSTAGTCQPTQPSCWVTRFESSASDAAAPAVASTRATGARIRITCFIAGSSLLQFTFDDVDRRFAVGRGDDAQQRLLFFLGLRLLVE